MVSRRKMLASLALTAGSLAACSVGAKSVVAPQSTPLPQKTNQPEKVQPVRFPFDDPPWWRDQAAQFTMMGLPVEYSVVPFTNLQDKVTASFVSGSCDFDAVHTHEMSTSTWASRGWLQPLEDWIDAATLADYPPSAILKMVGPDGKEHTYGLGLYVWLNSFYSRKDLTGSDEQPKSWDELITMAAKYRTTDTPGFLVALGGSSATVLYGTILRGEGGEVLTKGKPSFNNAAGLKALETMIHLKEILAPQSWEENSGSVTSTDFVAGGAVYAFAPPPTLVLAADPTKSKVVGKVAVGLVPGGSVNRSATYSENGSRAITACSPNQERAWKYIQAVTTPFEMIYMALALGRVPARFSALNSPLVQSAYPLAKVVPEQLKYPAGMITIHPNGPEMSKVIADQLVLAMKGTVSPKAALDAAETAVTKIVKDYEDSKK